MSVFHNVAVYEGEGDKVVAVCTCGSRTPAGSRKSADHYHAAHAWVAEPYMVA